MNKNRHCCITFTHAPQIVSFSPNLFHLNHAHAHCLSLFIMPMRRGAWACLASPLPSPPPPLGSQLISLIFRGICHVFICPSLLCEMQRRELRRLTKWELSASLSLSLCALISSDNVIIASLARTTYEYCRKNGLLSRSKSNNNNAPDVSACKAPVRSVCLSINVSHTLSHRVVQIWPGNLAAWWKLKLHSQW